MLKRCLTFILLCVLCLVPSAIACGCGLAIADMKVFNALKETQAYLLIDVKDATTYDEMPFFRFISMDQPHNVTIVFPMADIPYDVQGKKIKAYDFKRDYGINDAEYAAQQQDAGALVKDTSKWTFMLSNGIFSAFAIAFVRGQFGSLGEGFKGTGALAHFEFEGGTLDIYNVSTAQTLDEFVKTVDVVPTDKVKELVAKYNKYYVAVLRLDVPSVIPADEIAYLEQCMPAGLERIKQQLSTTESLTYEEVQHLIMTESAQGECKAATADYLRRYIAGATYASSEVEGTLVDMKFKDTSGFFYPTSLVESYKYPINEQQYYIRTPENLDVALTTSEIARTSNSNNQRWYKIETTKEDLKGTIVKAGFLAGVGDNWRSLISTLNDNEGWLVFALLLLSVAVPLIVLRKTEELRWTAITVAIVTYLAGGLLLSALLMFLMKKRTLALTYAIIWAALLLGWLL